MLLLLACTEPVPPVPTADTATTTDTTDTLPTTPTGPVPAVTDTTTRLHARYGTLPYVGWTQDAAAPVRVEYRFDDAGWRASPEVERDAGSHEQILLGIPYETDVDWRIVARQAVVAEGTLATGPAPGAMPVPTLETADPSRWFADGQYLLTSVNQTASGWSGGPFWTMILDRQGRVVWARRTTPWVLFAQVSTSDPHHLLLDQDTTWSDFDSSQSTVLRLTLDEDLDEVSTPGLQHAFVEHADGTLAWGSIVHDPTEALVELAPGASDVDVIWTCGDDWPGVYDCESNGLFYDPVQQRYLYSFWTNYSVVSVDRASGSTQWWAGNVGGGYDFVPASSQFILQHGVTWTDAGTFLVSSEASGPTTVLYEYEVDDAARELREVWSRDAGVYALYNGDAWRLPNGNTLHVVGNAGVIDEVDADGDVVWSVDWHAEHLLGRGEWIADLYDLVE